MKHTRICKFSICMAMLTLVSVSGVATADVTCGAGGQCSQTIQLVPGWNAIYLQVKPDDYDPATDDDFSTEVVFADFLDSSDEQIGSVWTWLPHRGRLEFVQSQSTEDLLGPCNWSRARCLTLHRVTHRSW